MRTSTIVAAVLALGASSAQAHYWPTQPHAKAGPVCTDVVVRVHASAKNFDFSSNSTTPPTVPVSGTFGVQSRFCTPSVRSSTHAHTLLVLSPGLTYNTLYWDLPFKPQNYSFVDYAAEHGFATLNLARLGAGQSEHPNPEIVQVPLHAAIVAEISRQARAGVLKGARGHRFQKIVGVGHSLASGIYNVLIANTPDVFDGVVFSGYAHVTNGPFPPLPGYLPASQVLPKQFKHLQAAYLTSENITTRAGLYGPAGTFDPALLQFDEEHKDLVTINEFLSFGLSDLPAPKFRGDVFTINGNVDFVMCTQPNCGNLAGEAQFYPKAKSVETGLIENAGHMINMHLSAPSFFKQVVDWLNRHNY